MSKLAEQFIKYALDNDITPEDFQEAIDYLYASAVDMILEDAPEGERQHRQNFWGA